MKVGIAFASGFGCFLSRNLLRNFAPKEKVNLICLFDLIFCDKGCFFYISIDFVKNKATNFVGHMYFDDLWSYSLYFHG